LRPKAVDPGFLPLQNGGETALHGAVERPGDLRPDLGRIATLGVVVAQVLRQADRPAALGPRLEHDGSEIVLAGALVREGASGVENVVHAAAQSQPRAVGGVAEGCAQPDLERPSRLQHPAGEADRQAGVGAVAAGQRRAARQLRGEDDLGIRLLRHHFILHRRQVPVVK
jgi:hypothetical protein